MQSHKKSTSTTCCCKTWGWRQITSTWFMSSGSVLPNRRLPTLTRLSEELKWQYKRFFFGDIMLQTEEYDVLAKFTIEHGVAKTFVIRCCDCTAQRQNGVIFVFQWSSHSSSSIYLCQSPPPIQSTPSSVHRWLLPYLPLSANTPSFRLLPSQWTLLSPGKKKRARERERLISLSLFLQLNCGGEEVLCASHGCVCCHSQETAVGSPLHSRRVWGSTGVWSGE